MEEWRAIPGYNGYEASSLGRVRSLDRTVAVCGKHRSRKYKGRLLKQIKTPRSLQHYWAVGVGHANMVLVHKLVALAFLREPKPGEEVCHNNDDGLDNRPENLRWGTRKSNVADNFIHGKANTGSRNGQSYIPNFLTIAREWRKSHANT